MPNYVSTFELFARNAEVRSKNGRNGWTYISMPNLEDLYLCSTPT